MTLLFLDTETSDIYKRNLPPDHAAQPWAVQVAAELCTPDGTPIDFFSGHVMADGRKIRAGAEATHGISSRRAASSGVSEIVVIGFLAGLIANARYVIGHGLTGFDRLVLEGVLIRRGRDPKLFSRPGLEMIDTMLLSTTFCRISPREERDDGQFKWPSLDEACEILLGEAPRTGEHDAWADCQRAKRLFYHLRDRGAVELAA